MKNIILITLILTALSLTGCYNFVTCNEPYIFVGSECCLDKNQNKVCDNDEINKEINTTKRMMDLQKTIGTIFNKNILLSKEEIYQGTQFYTHTDQEFLPISSCISRCAGAVHVKKIPVDIVSLGHIEKVPITEYQLKDYVISNKDHFFNKTRSLRNDFEKEFNSSEMGLQRYFEKKDIREYPFANFTISEKIIFDNITKLTALSDNSIVEIVYASINTYNVYYGSKKIAGFINRKEKQLDFLHAIVIYCRPEVTITLYGEKYDWRTLLNKEIYPEDVIKKFENNREFLLPKAKAILELCQKKYQHGEFLIES
jgi:hypothetical protein